MKYAGKFGSSGLDSLSNSQVDLDSFSFRDGHADSFTVPDAHLLFSGDFHKSGNDLVISDELHRVVVPNYFHGDKHPMLVSPEGASLDPKVVEALTGHTAYAQAGAPAANLVGHIAKMTGSASVVRSGVTVELHNGDAVYQNDVVQTGSGSTLGLVLSDGTTFNLNANARLMLNELTYDASSNSNSSLITLVQGAASFVAGQVAKTGDMKVATPIATMGIRGTAVILDISSADGTVSISVIDQQDNQVHAVQVFNTRGVLIGTVTSNGSILTLTPTAAFELIARESAKTLAQIAQEFATFQAVLNTYDIQKAIDPNLPQHTENNANPQTKFANIGSSTSPNSPGTEFRSALNTNVTNTGNTGTSQTFSVLMGTDNGTGIGGTSNQALFDQGIPGQQNDQNNQPTGPQPSIPFVVNPPTVTRISTISDGDHFGPVMSADGQFVTYDPDGVIYLFDRATGVTTVISPPGGIYGSPTISSDGHSVVYQSSNGVIFLYDNDPSSPQYHTTIQIGVGTSPAVSGDGSRIAVENGGNITVYDRQGHILTTITPADAGTGGSLLKPAISADGHVVAFWGADPGGSSGHLYVYDQSTGVISAIADTSQGVGASAASLSADGRYVVYQSADANGHSEIYLYDLQTHQIVFQTSNPGGGSYNPVISPDGHFIIFASDAALTSNDHNAVADTYVVNLTDPAHPTITLVSTAADGASGNAASNLGATISAGGLFIAFGSNASNLSTADGPGGDIFVVDPSSGRNAIVEQTASSGSVLTTSGKVGITGGINDVSLSVTDAAGNPTGYLQASFSADGNFVNWTFAENKSDFASLVYGDTATQQFLIKLTYSGGTTTIPITIGVHNAVSPTIPAADAPPVVHSATLAVSEGGVVLLTPANINVTDLDDSSFTFTVTNVTHGKFQVLGGEGWIDTASFTSADLAGGHVRFVHDGGEAAPTFSIQANDGETSSNVKVGGVTFTNVNDAPVASPVTLANGTEDAPYVIHAADLLAGVSDVDSQSLSITGVGIACGGGSLVDNHNGTWTYTPAPGYAGLVSFTYTASDGTLSASSTANLTLDCETAVAPMLTVGANVTFEPTDGAALRTSLELHAGDTVTFEWNFTTDDYLPYKDFAFATVNGAAFLLSNIASTGSYGSTGWHTFSYTATADGTYTIGAGVMNDQDTLVMSYLAVDDIEVNGTVVESFENGLSDSTTVGNVNVVTSAHSQHGPTPILPTDGSYEALLTSHGIPESQVEDFLGLNPGRLADVGQAEGPEHTPIIVPITVSIAGDTHPDETYVTIKGAPVGSIFNHGVYDAVDGSWRIEAADLGGNLTLTTPLGYSGTFELIVTATSVFHSSHASATTPEETQVVVVDDVNSDQAITPVSVTVHSPDGYDFSAFYDDLAASQFATADENGNHAFVVNTAKGITFEMIGSGYSVDPQTGVISNIINEIDIFGTTDPSQATPAHRLVSTLGWNIHVQAAVNPTGQDVPSDPVVQSTGLGTFDFSAVAFNYIGSSGPDVFLAGDHPDVFNGLGGGPVGDTVDYSHASGPISVNLLTGATAGTAAEGDLFSSIENLRGTAFDDVLTGDGHDNTLFGGAGNDMLFGGAGNDTFLFKQNAGGVSHDTIGDFTPGEDKIELDYAAFDPNSQESFNAWFQDHVAAASNGHDVQIVLDGNDHNTILLKNVTLAQLHANDFILPPGSV
ncbi:cadherin-like domain-containing protein [Bradyrhizobium sp. USDA 10063]